MSPTSISGGYCFGFQAVRISPASLNLGVIIKAIIRFDIKRAIII